MYAASIDAEYAYILTWKRFAKLCILYLHAYFFIWVHSVLIIKHKQNNISAICTHGNRNFMITNSQTRTFSNITSYDSKSTHLLQLYKDN